MVQVFGSGEDGKECGVVVEVRKGWVKPSDCRQGRSEKEKKRRRQFQEVRGSGDDSEGVCVVVVVREAVCV